MTWWLETFGSVGTALAIAAVFLVTFAIVGALGYLFLLRGRTSGPPTTESRTAASPGDTDRESPWTAEWSGELPVVTGRVEDQANDQSSPPIFDGTPIPPDPLVVVRGAAAKAYRWFMILVGLIGVAGGLALILSHTAANMLALPGGIVLVLSLGVLLSGLVPSRSTMGSFQTFDLTPLLRKVNVQVHHTAPLQLELTDDQTRRAIDLIKEGLPISEAARTVYPEFDRLDPLARQAIESALQQLAKGG